MQVRTPEFKQWFGDWELNSKSINIIKADKFNNAETARVWAEKNIVGLIEENPTGEAIRISKTAIRKYFHNSATKKSASKEAYFLAATALPEVIKHSVVGEILPDYKKVNGVRAPENEKNPHADILRLYGAVSIGGVVYRVKTTVNRFKDKNTYSYEMSEIELLSGSMKNDKGTLPRPSNSISTKTLLQGITKSYNDTLLLDDVSQVTNPKTSFEVTAKRYGGEQAYNRANKFKGITL